MMTDDHLYAEYVLADRLNRPRSLLLTQVSTREMHEWAAYRKRLHMMKELDLG